MALRTCLLSSLLNFPFLLHLFRVVILDLCGIVEHLDLAPIALILMMAFPVYYV